MKKKGLILLVCLALVSTLAVNGTFAQELKNAAEAALKYFQTLTGIGAPETGTALEVDLYSTSDKILAPSHYDGEEFDWNSTGVVNHSTYVKNVSTDDAYVRICIAVRKVDGILYARVLTADGFTTFHSENQVPSTVKIANKDFYLYTFDYNVAVEQNETTSTIKMQFGLDKNATNADIAALDSDFIQVKSFAIQASAFVGSANSDETSNLMEAVDALDAALGPISNFNPFE